MTSSTDCPAVTAPPGGNLHAAAETIDASLRLLARNEALTPGEEAAALLNLSPAGLLDEMTAGRLSGLIVDGQVWVNGPALQAVVRDTAVAEATRTAELRPLVRRALRAFLADRPVLALWDEAVGDRRPLVCARRGAARVNYGIEYHSVVMKVAWLVEYSLDPQVRAGHPEFAALPTGPVLSRAVVELPGVSTVRYATPLAEQGEQDPQSHRLSGWVRLDPRVWPLQVPDGIARLVDGPVR